MTAAGIVNLAGCKARVTARQYGSELHAAIWTQIPSGPSNPCGGVSTIISGILEHAEAEMDEFAHGGTQRRHLALPTAGAMPETG